MTSHSMRSPRPRWFEDLKALFERDLQREFALRRVQPACSLAPRDLFALPACVRNFVVATGAADHSYAQNARIAWRGMQLRSAPDAAWLRVTCEQVNFFDPPARLALMRSKLAGLVPFTGYDRYRDARGRLFINLAGRAPLKRAYGPHIDDSELVTYLSEAMLLPALFLDPRLQWQALDEQSARASIHLAGSRVAGVFTFDPAHDWARFESDDRWRDGRVPSRQTWSAEVSRFAVHGGLRVPEEARAWWHGPEQKFLYMRGRIDSITYDVTEACVMSGSRWSSTCCSSRWARRAPGGRHDFQEDSDRARLLGARGSRDALRR